MSSPQQCVYTTSIIRLHTLRPHTGCSFHAESLLRASSTRSDRRWCLRASRPYCWQACGTRISRPSSCGGLGTNIALFIGSGEGNPHELLLANLLQGSRSTFLASVSQAFLPSKKGMLNIPISVLGGWPTVSGRFSRYHLLSIR